MHDKIREMPLPGGVSCADLLASGLAAADTGTPVSSGPRRQADLVGADCLCALRKGDVLVVWKLDRLGRNLAHLVNTVQDLSAR